MTQFSGSGPTSDAAMRLRSDAAEAGASAFGTHTSLAAATWKTGLMASSLLDHLLARIVDSGLLDDPVAENGLVYGRATIDAAGAVVTVNVDPELEDDEETLDDDALLEAITRILSVSETRWRAVIDEVADDIDEAVDDEPVLEQIDLRDDLEATSVVVFADAVLIAFDAPKQFPDSRILVQLDDDLDVANIEVRDRAEVETVEVDDIDDLLDGLSGDDR